MLPILTLALGGLSLLFFGACALLFPDALQVTGIVVDSAAARTEVRAFYGGLELTLGGFICACLYLREQQKTGLWLMLVIFLGIAAGRVAGIAIEGSSSSFHSIALLVEVLLAAMAGLALRAQRTQG